MTPETPRPPEKLWVIYSRFDPESSVLVSASSRRSLRQDCHDFPHGHVYQYDVDKDGKSLISETYLGVARDVRRCSLSPLPAQAAKDGE